VGFVGLLDADRDPAAVVAVARDPAQRVGDAQQIAVDVAPVLRLRAVGCDQRDEALLVVVAVDADAALSAS
jgi:hypothetical protein